MSLIVSSKLISNTTSPSFADYRARATVRGDDDYEWVVEPGKLTSDGLTDLLHAARSSEDNSIVRAVEAMIASRSGESDIAVPNFKAFQSLLVDFLTRNMIDGWIYVRGADGRLYPELVTAVVYDDGRKNHGRKEAPSVTICTMYFGHGYGRNNETTFGCHTSGHYFQPQDVTRRRIGDALIAKGILVETPDLREDFNRSLERYRNEIFGEFAEQFRVTGAAFRFEEDHYRREGTLFEGRRVIHDLDRSESGAFQNFADSALHIAKGDGTGPVPEHPIVKVFDLKTHEWMWVHSDNLTAYEYDKDLRDKLILPDSHRDLLDVLTSDLTAFVDDFIEGKSAGNVILAKGPSGVGKTLTAEVYAELIERPLYSIHSGNLGTTAAEIENNLKVLFQLAKRWNCVMLLDEADVFVAERGNDIEQNAIVAEFLRALEYFDGLLFMTTNRSNNIDDAILSRCAAIIAYERPDPTDARKLWAVMATQFRTSLSTTLIDQLVSGLGSLSGRDIKNLFRLALRVAAKSNTSLTFDVFRRCAVFRGVNIQRAAR